MAARYRGEGLMTDQRIIVKLDDQQMALIQFLLFKLVNVTEREADQLAESGVVHVVESGLSQKIEAYAKMMHAKANDPHRSIQGRDIWNSVGHHLDDILNGTYDPRP